MLHKDTKAMGRLPDGETDFFDTDTGVLQENTCTLVPFQFIICLVDELRTSIDLVKEYGFTIKNTRRYLTETIMDADNADDLTLHANTTAQTESLLHRQEA